MGAVTYLDVSAVIEEVLEGVFAGFEFNGLSSQGLADTTKSRTRDLANPAKSLSPEQQPYTNDQLTVILDIDLEEWKFPTVPGTWRRLTMNLFGNALKYTPSGFIKIKLSARNVLAAVKGGCERTMITMIVSDSGKGMTPDFMKTKLFMPFSQV